VAAEADVERPEAAVRAAAREVAVAATSRLLKRCRFSVKSASRDVEWTA
jgi:hypothetical protein